MPTIASNISLLLVSVWHRLSIVAGNGDSGFFFSPMREADFPKSPELTTVDGVIDVPPTSKQRSFKLTNNANSPTVWVSV